VNRRSRVRKKKLKVGRDDCLYISKNCRGIIHIWDPIYKLNFYYVSASDGPEFAAICKKRLRQDVDAYSGQNGKFQVVKYGPGDVGILWAKDNLPHLVAHECFHAMTWAFGERGVAMTQDADEVGAYYLAFLIEEIYRYVKPRRKP
jgi:hypothetical protein